jgi:hypothetical protein
MCRSTDGDAYLVCNFPAITWDLEVVTRHHYTHEIRSVSPHLLLGKRIVITYLIHCSSQVICFMTESDRSFGVCSAIHSDAKINPLGVEAGEPKWFCIVADPTNISLTTQEPRRLHPRSCGDHRPRIRRSLCWILLPWHRTT